MKTLLIALTWSLGIALTANAQVDKKDKTHKAQQTRVETRDQQKSVMQAQPNVERQVKSQTEMMTRDLDLQPEQAQRITVENRNLYNHMNHLSNRDLSEQDYHKRQQEVMEQHDQRVKEILTDEQYRKYANTKTNYFKDLHNSKSAQEYRSPN